MNNFLILQSPHLQAGGDWVWDWLRNLIGDGPATTVQTVFSICIYGICAYIIVIQVLRLLTNLSNRNAEDAKLRAESRENIKSSAFIIIAVGLVGVCGFTALSFAMNYIFQKGGGGL